MAVEMSLGGGGGGGVSSLPVKWVVFKSPFSWQHPFRKVPYNTTMICVSSAQVINKLKSAFSSEYGSMNCENTERRARDPHTPKNEEDDALRYARDSQSELDARSSVPMFRMWGTVRAPLCCFDFLCSACKPLLLAPCTVAA